MPKNCRYFPRGKSYLHSVVYYSMIQKIFILLGPFYGSTLFLHPMEVAFGYVTHFGQKKVRAYDIWIHPSRGLSVLAWIGLFPLMLPCTDMRISLPR